MFAESERVLIKETVKRNLTLVCICLMIITIVLVRADWAGLVTVRYTRLQLYSRTPSQTSLNQ